MLNLEKHFPDHSTCRRRSRMAVPFFVTCWHFTADISSLWLLMKYP